MGATFTGTFDLVSAVDLPGNLAIQSTIEPASGGHGETFLVTIITACPADLDGDGDVDIDDFLDLLAAWGPCP